MRNPDTGTLRGRHMTRSLDNGATLEGRVGQTVRVSYRDREGKVSERVGKVDSFVGEVGTAKRSVILDTDKGPRSLNLLRVTVLD